MSGTGSGGGPGSGGSGTGGGGGGGGKTVAGQLGQKAKDKTLESIKKQLSEIQNTLNSEKSAYAVEDFGLLAPGEITLKRLEKIEKALQRTAAMGAPFAKGGKLNKALTEVAETFDEFAGNAEIGTKAFNALMSNMSSFATMAELGDEGFKKLTQQLTTQAAALEKFGLSFADYTKNVDIAQNMLNLTKEQVLGLNQGLVDFSKEMRMLPGIVSQNFQLVAKSLAYNAPTIVDQFKNIQKMSQQTGVTVGTLMGGFGDRMDTIGGAASFTGQLNAILGGNFFSPNEILLMDEDERMIRIRQVIQNHPVMGEIEQGGKLGKFALNTVSKLVGFSKEDTRKFLMGKMDDKTLKGKLMAETEAQAGAAGGRLSFGKDPTGERQIAFTKDIIATLGSDSELVKAMKTNTNMMKEAFLSIADQAKAGERAKFIRAARGDAAANQQDQLEADLIKATKRAAIARFGTGFAGQFGFKTEEEENKLTRALMRVPQLDQLLYSAQTLPQGGPARKTLQAKIDQIVESASKRRFRPDPKFDAQLNDAIRFSRRGGTSFARPFEETADPVTSGEQGALRIVEGLFGKRGFGVYPQMLAIFRLGGNQIQQGQTLISDMAEDASLPEDARKKLETAYEELGKLEGGTKGSLKTRQSIAPEPSGDTGAESATPTVTRGAQTGQNVRRRTGGSTGGVLEEVQNMFAGINVFFKFDDGTASKVTVAGINSTV